MDLKSFFAVNLTPPDGHHGERQLHEVRYAAAVLLVVCARADFEKHPEEERAIIQLLEETFSLEHELIETLLEHIQEEEIVKSLQQITELVNRHYTMEDKHVLIENLWKVTYADGRLDKFEEQFISRVAFMIDVPESRVQACKLSAAPES